MPLILEMAPVINRWIGAMKLVSSAVWLYPIEQRYRKLVVRTLQKVWSPEARNPFLVLWGRESPERARPEGPLWSRPEGQKNEGAAISQIRKRKRANDRIGRARSSMVPVRHANKFARTKKQTICNIPNPQASARNLKKRQRAGTKKARLACKKQKKNAEDGT